MPREMKTTLGALVLASTVLFSCNSTKLHDADAGEDTSIEDTDTSNDTDTDTTTDDWVACDPDALLAGCMVLAKIEDDEYVFVARTQSDGGASEGCEDVSIYYGSKGHMYNYPLTQCVDGGSYTYGFAYQGGEAVLYYEHEFDVDGGDQFSNAKFTKNSNVQSAEILECADVNLSEFTFYCLDNPIDAVWVDATTGLKWSRYNGAEALYDDAVSYCNNLVLNGVGGFRIPNIEELRSLVRGCEATELEGVCQAGTTCTNSTCDDESVCQGCPEGEGAADGCYWPTEFNEVDPGPTYCFSTWSTTEVSDTPGGKWGMDFSSARAYAGNGTGHAFVRCVK